MDSLVIKTDFAKDVISRILKKRISKAVGHNIDILIKHLTVSIDDAGELQADINTTIRIGKDDILKIFKGVL